MRRLRFNLTDRTVVGKVNSQMVHCRFLIGSQRHATKKHATRAGGSQPTLVFVICNRRGDKMRATRDVEKSISITAMLPSLVS